MPTLSRQTVIVGRIDSWRSRGFFPCHRGCCYQHFLGIFFSIFLCCVAFPFSNGNLLVLSAMPCSILESAVSSVTSEFLKVVALCILRIFQALWVPSSPSSTSYNVKSPINHPPFYQTPQGDSASHHFTANLVRSISLLLEFEFSDFFRVLSNGEFHF